MSEQNAPQEEQNREEEHQEEQVQEEQDFELNEPVIIREDFHSRYFQGLSATIASPGREGRNGETLWTIKLEKPPHEMVISGKYLRRPTEDDLASGDHRNNGPAKKRSLLARIVPWGRS